MSRAHLSAFVTTKSADKSTQVSAILLCTKRGAFVRKRVVCSLEYFRDDKHNGDESTQVSTRHAITPPVHFAHRRGERSVVAGQSLGAMEHQQSCRGQSRQSSARHSNISSTSKRKRRAFQNVSKIEDGQWLMTAFRLHVYIEDYDTTYKQRYVMEETRALADKYIDYNVSAAMYFNVFGVWAFSQAFLLRKLLRS